MLRTFRNMRQNASVKSVTEIYLALLYSAVGWRRERLRGTIRKVLSREMSDGNLIRHVMFSVKGFNFIAALEGTDFNIAKSKRQLPTCFALLCSPPSLPLHHFTICRARVCLNFTHIRSRYAQEEHLRLPTLFIVRTQPVCYMLKKTGIRNHNKHRRGMRDTEPRKTNN